MEWIMKNQFKIISVNRKKQLKSVVKFILDKTDKSLYVNIAGGFENIKSIIQLYFSKNENPQTRRNFIHLLKFILKSAKNRYLSLKYLIKHILKSIQELITQLNIETNRKITTSHQKSQLQIDNIFFDKSK